MKNDGFDRWVNLAANAYTFWGIVPPGLLAVIGALLSTGVHWISQFGAFGWFMSGLLVFVLSSLGFGVLARTRLWRIESKSRNRMIGDSSHFDPMARVYENKRLYLRDLAPVGRRQVKKKKFIACEIIGPGTVVLGTKSSDKIPFPQMKDCNTFDVDCIEIAHNVRSQLAVDFLDCDFDGCSFYSLTLLFLVRENDSLHWITPVKGAPAMPEGSIYEKKSQ
jgi:hypothetical protein